MIDDDIINLRMAEKILEKFFHVTCLQSGIEALSLLQNQSFDLILLDIHMPGMDGFALLDKLKSIPNTKEIPVIFLSADTETDTEYVGYTVNPLTDTVRREAVVLKKSEWRELYRKGDTLIKIHIPYGGRLDKELCQNAYARARDIFKRCFSEYDIRGFTTCCWMLSPELSDILAPDANIIAFKKDYTVFPALSSGMDVFLYVYGIEAGDIEEIDIEALPDDNTLRRGIKEKLKSGLYINQFNGYMPL